MQEIHRPTCDRKCGIWKVVGIPYGNCLKPRNLWELLEDQGVVLTDSTEGRGPFSVGSSPTSPDQGAAI